MLCAAYGPAINGTSVDLDNGSVSVTGGVTEPEGGGTTLFTKRAGFRFPYVWRGQGNIKNNIKFLEEQLNTYLHTHREGFAQEVPEE